MRLRPGYSQERGSILIVALLTAAVLGTAVGGYLQYSRAQVGAVIRSQTWNAAIPVCEAGIEEALAHINDSAIGTNFALNGWTISGNLFTRTRTFGDGSYSVNISTGSYPSIRSTATLTGRDRIGAISRTVLVTTTKWATGMKGMIARGNIDMQSQTEVDSFDSEDARYSTRGHYDATKRKDNGFVGSVDGNIYGATVDGSVATGPLGSASGNVGDLGWLGSNTGIEPGHYANDLNIAFPVVQAPFDGGAFPPGGGNVTLTNLDYWSTQITTDTYPVSPPASAITTNNFGTLTKTTYPVGVIASTVTTNTTSTRTKTMPASGTYLNLVLQGAWYYYDLITSYTYPVRTYTYSMTAPNSSVTTEYYDKVLSGSRYQVDSLSLSGSERLIVTGPDVTLYVKGNFSMTGNSKLIITPGARLKIYVAGDTSLAGNGVFNYTLDASAFMYYGLPSNTSIAISGNATFTGVIYAPAADMRLNGGGNTIYDVVGATVTKTATMNGHFRFHYDERLGRTPIQSRFSVASWHEI